MDIKDIEVLIECKRLVEMLLRGKRGILKYMDECGKGTKFIQKEIYMLERALEGKPPLTFEERFKKEFE